MGSIDKAEVRRLAAAMGLRTASKPDSQDVCFITSTGGRETFLGERIPFRAARVVDTDGTELGSVPSVELVTIGQRRGLGIAVGEPRYVVDIDPKDRTVVVGTYEELLVDGCTVSGVSFTSGSAPETAEVTVKVRYRSKAVGAALQPSGDDWEVVFDEPHPAPAPGQAAVFYDGDRVLGGGTITGVIRA